MKKIILFLLLFILIIFLFFLISLKFVDYSKFFNNKTDNIPSVEDIYESELEDEIPNFDNLSDSKTNSSFKINDQDTNGAKVLLLLDDSTIEEVMKLTDNYWYSYKKKTYSYDIEKLDVVNNFDSYSMFFYNEYIYVCNNDNGKCDLFKYTVDDYKYQLFDKDGNSLSDDLALYYSNPYFKLFLFNDDLKKFDIYQFKKGEG